jgi:hypothetical protein
LTFTCTTCTYSSLLHSPLLLHHHLVH